MTIMDPVRSAHKIIIGDARDMSMIDDTSVHLAVTSPPYWQLKDYGKGGQIGYHDTYQDYINHLNIVWLETFRVLKPGCRLCINIGDQFARALFYGRYKVIPIRTEIIKFCEFIGFDYMGAIIWQKITTTHTTGGAVVMGSYPYPRNGILKIDYEFILIFKKPGTAVKPDQKFKAQSGLTLEEWNEYFRGHWKFPGEKQRNHQAVFPLELPSRLIRMFSFVGDTVLDPFLGSGTTAVSARNLNRNSLGIEINEKFLPAIKKRMEFYEPNIFFDLEISFAENQIAEQELDKKINSLPYVFKDPKQISRSTIFSEPGKQQEKQTAAYYTVKQVISGDLLHLSNGKNLKLLGIKILKAKEQEAIAFLAKKTKSQKVYVRFDGRRVDDAGNWLGYLYLKNKTFLNAHLIKAGLAVVEEGKSFRYRSRFITYQRQVEAPGRGRER
jgi:DNA modification methylase/endonuclease YncB( thermonuclease family)